MFDFILNTGSIYTIQNLKSVEMCKEQTFFLQLSAKKGKTKVSELLLRETPR